VIAALQIQTGQGIAANLPAADVNGDSRIGTTEAVFVLHYLAK
jgi:hypothetical protein